MCKMRTMVPQTLEPIVIVKYLAQKCQTGYLAISFRMLTITIQIGTVVKMFVANVVKIILKSLQILERKFWVRFQTSLYVFSL